MPERWPGGEWVGEGEGGCKMDAGNAEGQIRERAGEINQDGGRYSSF